MNPQRTIFHLDMDAFYAAIEQRDQPELRGKPVIVGGIGRRGVVSTASYEARRFGVHSAMPMFEARKRAPDAVYLPTRIGHYAKVSEQLMAILESFSPVVEPLSLDEAFIDMTGTERLFGPAEAAADTLRARVRDELELTASVGIATNKFIAKVASDARKPDGLTICPPGQERAFLAPLPIERIWGVGKRAAASLHRLQLRTIGELAEYPAELLERSMGDFGRHVWRLAHGLDERPVAPERRRKSIGQERTLTRNVRGRDAIERLLVPLADEVARLLRAKDKRAGGIRLKLKTADFRVTTRDRRVPEGVADASSILREVGVLLDRVDLGTPVRLVGIAAYDLMDMDATRQQGLFGASSERHERLERALDAVAARFGSDAVGRAGFTLEEE